MRSQLYVPGNNEKMIRKSTQLPADSVVLDLEDAVPNVEKAKARDLLSSLFSELDWGKRRVCVRVNPTYTLHYYDDVKWVVSQDKVTCLLVPEAEDGLSSLHRATGKDVEPLIETARGLLKVQDIVREEGVFAVSFGSADLALSMNGDPSVLGTNQYIRTAVVAAARAYGVEPLDRVFFDLRDLSGFESECKSAKSMGYSGKQVIHPVQVDVANKVFSPTEEEVRWAKKVVDIYESRSREGKGALRIDDRLVDAVHYRMAKRILDSLGG
ncbi:CoA ester lyase [Sulfodiicoccus acidiphilus]|uniref:CoA ester lyase n=1 Tax=Sulfodiicoccus acidiphilus TaxID=1670455 RepID=A0A348B4L8_9CREN|nr:CoA ester lyase [Sulfodiicoccus acidiphilus]BBD73120.1 CoA ester lyase [Sulfodiicoccus acidiphilus]GGU00652.1 CoA ester lyase [Sulfodiicoccus acidiphilus]